MCQKEPTNQDGQDNAQEKPETKQPGEQNESAVLVEYVDFKLNQFAERIEQALSENGRRFDQLQEAISNQTLQLQQAIQVAAKAQQEMGQYLNRAYERHALNPAILIVAGLAEELLHQKQLANQIASKISGCTSLQPLLEAASIGGQVAQDRLAYLDIEQICPEQGEELDLAKHETASVEDTEDQGLHRKIAQLISPGLIFRGEVLRQAKVSVFRFIGQAQTAP